MYAITVFGVKASLASRQVFREAPLRCLHCLWLRCGIHALRCHPLLRSAVSCRTTVDLHWHSSCCQRDSHARPTEGHGDTTFSPNALDWQIHNSNHCLQRKAVGYQGLSHKDRHHRGSFCPPTVQLHKSTHACEGSRR